MSKLSCCTVPPDTYSALSQTPMCTMSLPLLIPTGSCFSDALDIHPLNISSFTSCFSESEFTMGASYCKAKVSTLAAREPGKAGFWLLPKENRIHKDSNCSNIQMTLKSCWPASKPWRTMSINEVLASQMFKFLEIKCHIFSLYIFMVLVLL